MATLISCVVFAALQGNALLVGADSLSGMQDVLLLDARPPDVFTAGHIPGAANLDVDLLSQTRNEVPGMLRPLWQVRKALSDSGVDPAKHIVIYSELNKPGDFKTAARLFWILEYAGYGRVSILDGGFAKWQAEGKPVEKGVSKVEAVKIPKLEVQPQRLATLKEVEKAIDTGDAQLLDLRPPDYYDGEKKAGVAKEAGHIPGAGNIPDESFLSTQDCSVKPLPELESMAAADGVKKDVPVITYCNTGRAASVGYFMMRLMGHDKVSMFDGSMAEWTAKGKKTVSGNGSK